jgi:hypothetical protein
MITFDELERIVVGMKMAMGLFSFYYSYICHEKLRKNM